MSAVLGLLFWLATSQGAAASRANAGPERATIQGAVIRAGAAAAGARQELADARVELKPGNLSVLTGSDGSFTFRNLSPGKYTISATHDGFVPQEDRAHGLTAGGLSVTVAPGQTLKGIVLPMAVSPVITGKVFDPQGEPLAAALVRAYHRQYTPYGTQLKIIKKGMTNDFGEFRLFGLTFGQYFLSAGYGDRDRSLAIGKVQLSVNVSKADEGFSTVFYDGSEDISRAQPARLVPGVDPGTIDIYLRDPARFRIRGQVLPPLPGTKIVLAPKGSDLTDADYFIQPNAAGAFEIRGISPGSYVAFASTDDDLNESEVVSINVTDSDIDGLRLPLANTFPVTGTVSGAGNARATFTGMRVKLVRSTPEFDRKLDAVVTPDGTFTFPHVAPFAEYDVGVAPLPSGTYIKSITASGRNFLQGKARFLPGALLQISLAPAPAGLDVQVTKGTEPSVGVQVVLIPDPPYRRRPERYITGVTDEAGNARLASVAPGNYTAYAFEQLEPGAYYALGYGSEYRFRDRAASVSVGDSSPRPIYLRPIPAEETAGGFQ